MTLRETQNGYNQTGDVIAKAYLQQSEQVHYSLGSTKQSGSVPLSSVCYTVLVIAERLFLRFHCLKL